MVILTPIENESLQVFLKSPLPTNHMDIPCISFSVRYEKRWSLFGFDLKWITLYSFVHLDSDGDDNCKILT
jgi:hypothetical protein